MREKGSEPLRPEVTATPGRGQCPPFDPALALERVDGDALLLRELAEMFLHECPRLTDEIRQAVTGRDGPRLRMAAHTLKGSVGTFAASEAQEAAGQLEQIGRDETWADADAAWATLEVALGRLRPALAELARG
jgi:two-component system sensor histidine kinase/response regulator